MKSEEAPVITFGQRHHALEPQVAGPFRLARVVTGRRLTPGRPYFFIDSADPVTTRVLQNHSFRPEVKTKWLTEFAEKRPLDPLLCWLVVMRAVDVRDVLNAIGEYGWSIVVGPNPAEGPIPARVRIDNVSGDVVEFRRRVEWALEECESRYGIEYLERTDASILLSACEAVLEAEKEDRGT